MYCSGKGNELKKVIIWSNLRGNYSVLGSREITIAGHCLKRTDIKQEAYIKEALGFPLLECSLIPSRCILVLIDNSDLIQLLLWNK
nr:hypothetical protein [Tanacetum cinerariifolium]